MRPIWRRSRRGRTRRGLATVCRDVVGGARGARRGRDQQRGSLDPGLRLERVNPHRLEPARLQQALDLLRGKAHPDVSHGLAVLVALAPRDAPAQPRRPADRYDDAFRKYSKRYFGPAFDWRIFKAQGMAESNLDPKARSWVGARGVMQLMPATFNEIRSRNPDLQRIDSPEMNIAAGIAYDRALWTRWEGDSVIADTRAFTFASYNAGRRTVLNAQDEARASRLDPRSWPSIETVAPKVKRWRHEETIGYVRRIGEFHARLDDRGRVMVDSVTARGVKR